MIKLTVVKKPEDFPKLFPREFFVDFLYNHLDKYRDDRKDIEKAIDYVFSDSDGKGGFIVLAIQNASLVGGVVVNDTGMSGYIPGHILVYIVTHKEYRGQGIGRELIERVKEECTGNIALHVEYDNPAKFLYEKAGFTSKYMEMRYKNN
ncbi:MAG: GNAT family N-acetyltransferase [Candidatus Thermoplasmatota archaeon]|nr:GNAT family N-acetyltransferase [Candidatus Thermoplasmatota archaeon]